MSKLTPEQIALLKKPLPKSRFRSIPRRSTFSSIKGIYVVERLNEVGSALVVGMSETASSIRSR
jgi:hypothetical protein